MARRNTGSIRQKRPGVFLVAVDISRVKKLTPKEWASPITRQRRYETVEGTREDAERRLHELQYEADTGTLPTGKVTLNTWLDYWLREYVATELRPSTIEDYRMQVRNYIGPMLGAMYLADLKAHHIQEFQNKLAGKVGASVVRKLRQVLSGALREAVNCDLIPANPVHKTRTPKLVHNEVAAPPVEQVQQLLADAAGDKYFAALWLIAHTGLRAGEALGLEWRHIDVINRRPGTQRPQVRERAAGDPPRQRNLGRAHEPPGHAGCAPGAHGCPVQGSRAGLPDDVRGVQPDEYSAVRAPQVRARSAHSPAAALLRHAVDGSGCCAASGVGPHGPRQYCRYGGHLPPPGRRRGP